jgi:hypothetical protein
MVRNVEHWYSMGILKGVYHKVADLQSIRGITYDLFFRHYLSKLLSGFLSRKSYNAMAKHIQFSYISRTLCRK